MLPLGQVVMTPGIQNLFGVRGILDLQRFVRRHQSGDWGDLDDFDREQNEIAIREGNRILSVYNYENTKFYIITEADRSVTTALLPDEY